MSRRGILLLLPVLLVACNAREISVKEFVELYSSPRTTWKHADYAGVVKGFHCLNAYGFRGNGTVIEKLETVCVSVDSLPKTFPESPQQELQASNAVYLIRKSRNTP